MSRYEWITADGLVASGPIVLRSISVVSDGVGAADATIYDGISDDGQTVAKITALSGDTRTLSFGDGIILPTGLYVDVGSNVTGVSIVWDALEPVPNA
jgi:hypothetical protein